MADDSNDNINKVTQPAETEDSSGSIDIESMRVRLLVICRDMYRFEASANYLIRRGWETKLTNNVKEAFKIIGTSKPDFILISVNMPVPKADQLPTLLEQTFNIPTVIFSEDGDTKSLLLMKEITASYRMPGVISGPSVHRRIKNILQEIHSGTPGSQKGMHGGETIENQGEREVLAVRSAGDSNPSKNYIFEGEAKRSPTTVIVGAQEGRQKKSSVIVPESKNHKEIIGIEELEKLAKEHAPQWESSLSGSEKHLEQLSQDSSHARGINLLDQISIVENLDVRSKEFEHFILRLAKACVLDPREPVIPLTTANECTLYPMTLPESEGFLVIAHSGSREEGIKYNVRFKDLLQVEINQNFSRGTVEEQVVTKLEDVDLMQSLEDEIFTAKLRNGQSEVLIKYLLAREVSPTVVKDKGMDKLKITPKELVVEVNPGVDIYLHMPKNEKYFLYFKRSSTVSEKQREKLIASQAQIFINEADLEKYKKYFTRNQTVEILRQLKKITKKSA